MDDERDDQRLLDQDEMPEERSVGDRRAPERDVGLAGLGRGDVLRGCPAADVDLRLGMLLAERAQDQRGDVEVARDAQRAISFRITISFGSPSAARPIRAARSASCRSCAPMLDIAAADSLSRRPRSTCPTVRPGRDEQAQES
jgi:hypothetical protein